MGQVSEEYEAGLIRIWIPKTLARELLRLAGELTPDNLQTTISKALDGVENATEALDEIQEEALSIVLNSDTYSLLDSAFPNAVSDSHKIQLLVGIMNSK